jgi:hypothetical protein
MSGIEKFPFISVLTELVVGEVVIVAPATPMPVCESTTVPTIVPRSVLLVPHPTAVSKARLTINAIKI